MQCKRDMGEGGHAARRPLSRALWFFGVALDAYATLLALAWAMTWIVGSWCWPLPIALHAWALSGPLLLAGLLSGLQRRGAASMALHLALLLGWSAGHAPRLLRTAPALPRGAAVLITLNAGNGRASPKELVRWVRAQDADALFLQELNAAQANALEVGCRDVYPFRELHGLGLRGIGVLSRTPVSRMRLRELPDQSLALIGELELRGRRVLFAVVHLSGWTAVLGPWGSADESIAQVITELGEAELALVTGDFNASGESPLLGPLRQAGFDNAFDQVGRGLGLSFPEFRRYRGLPLPPLVRIDHMFLRGLDASAADLGTSAGSDHRALRVTVATTATH